MAGVMYQNKAPLGRVRRTVLNGSRQMSYQASNNSPAWHFIVGANDAFLNIRDSKYRGKVLEIVEGAGGSSIIVLKVHGECSNILVKALTLNETQLYSGFYFINTCRIGHSDIINPIIGGYSMVERIQYMRIV